MNLELIELIIKNAIISETSSVTSSSVRFIVRVNGIEIPQILLISTVNNSTRYHSSVNYIMNLNEGDVIDIVAASSPNSTTVDTDRESLSLTVEKIN